MTRPILHRGVAPIPNEMLVRINGGRCLGDPDEVFLREHCASRPPLHRARHEVIGRRFGLHPRVPVWEVAVMMLVAFAIGFGVFSL